MQPFYFKKHQFYFIPPPAILLLCFTFLLIINGCGGTATTGGVSGQATFGVQPTAFQLVGSYPVIPLSKAATLQTTTPEKIIKFRRGLTETDIAKIVTAIGGRLKRKIYGTENYYVVTFGTYRYPASFSPNPDIESIADNIILHASQVPNDSSYSSQWGCRMMYFPQAWDVQKGENAASPVIVAVIDTGVRLTHEDLSANLIIPTDQCNFVVDPNSPLATNPSDDNGHGTHVSGIINAVTNNSTGVVGMAWNVKVLPVKVLDATGSGSFDQVISGINYAIDKGAKVINMSLGGTTPNPMPQVFIDVINKANTNNVTIVAATGNEDGPVNFPANYPGIIAVAALGPDGNRASYSNYGPEVFVSAPGGAASTQESQNILSTFNTNDHSYASLSGTSMAAPHIAGLVALLYAQNSGITPAQVRDKLKSFTVDKGTPGFDNEYGYGMPDAYAVLSGKAIRLSEIKVYAVSINKIIEVTQYPDGLGNYTMNGLNPGNKYICAYLDKNMNGQVDSGDLFGYKAVTIQAGITIPNVNISLTDIINPAPSLTTYLQAALP